MEGKEKTVFHTLRNRLCNSSEEINVRWQTAFRESYFSESSVKIYPSFSNQKEGIGFREGGHDEGEGAIELGVHDQIGDLIEDGLKKNFRKKS
jgi:hypothetical protein